jgi:hypothetical protein
MTQATHTGRFKFDDTARKWFMRIFATIGVIAVTLTILGLAGLIALFN